MNTHISIHTIGAIVIWGNALCAAIGSSISLHHDKIKPRRCEIVSGL